MAIPTRRCVRGEGSVRVGLGRVSLNSSPSPGPNPSPNPNPDQAADARDEPLGLVAGREEELVELAKGHLGFGSRMGFVTLTLTLALTLTLTLAR